MDITTTVGLLKDNKILGATNPKYLIYKNMESMWDQSDHLSFNWLIMSKLGKASAEKSR